MNIKRPLGFGIFSQEAMEELRRVAEPASVREKNEQWVEDVYNDEAFCHDYRDQIIKYHNDGISTTDIALHFGVSVQIVRALLLKQDYTQEDSCE